MTSRGEHNESRAEAEAEDSIHPCLHTSSQTGCGETFLFARKIGSLYAQSFFRLSNHSISRDGHESAFDILGMLHSIIVSTLRRREGGMMGGGQ